MSYPVIPTADDRAHFERVSNYTRQRTGHADAPEFAKWRKRVTMERMIIRKACRDLIAAGCTISVDYDEDDGPELVDSTDLNAIMGTIQACDEERLRVKRDGKHLGTIYLVYGNDGWDVICDYSVSLEPYLQGANELADKVSA
jgi:hypothetical protein